MTAEAALAPPKVNPSSETVTRRDGYRCDCGYELRVFGTGRHRVYFQPADARLDDPVMNGSCPDCGRELPGKRRS